MRVAWLADPGNQDGSIGGAELTAREFAAGAPRGTTIVYVAPDRLEEVRGCDVACVFNSVTYPAATVRALSGKRVVRYWNDVAVHGDPQLRGWLLLHATSIFTSPLHRERFPHENKGGRVIPPAVDLERFRAAGSRANGRAGNVCVGAWMNQGKAPQFAAEWARDHDGIDFYGGGPLAPHGSEPVDYDDMPDLLAQYKRFVYLPAVLEPFGRLVVEAWATGCEVIINRLVGARHWIEHDPEALDTASSDFWSVVLDG